MLFPGGNGEEEVGVARRPGNEVFMLKWETQLCREMCWHLLE